MCVLAHTCAHACTHLWNIRDIVGVKVLRILGSLGLDVKQPVWVCENQCVAVGGYSLCLSECRLLRMGGGMHVRSFAYCPAC